MNTLNTIERPHRIFNTSGSSPLLVTCEDLEEWVCKYDRSPQALFKEYVASEFARIWGIRTPDTCFIHVQEEHVPVGMGLHLFQKECFGSKFLENTKEIDSTLLPLLKEQNFINQIANKKDFLKIALFDIWLSNEDRNHNNFNLLLDISTPNQYLFYAIDHVNIFNTSFLDHNLTPLTMDESIICTEEARLLFSHESNFSRIFEELIEELPIYVKQCEDNLDDILQDISPSWGINVEIINQNMRNFLFNSEWKTSCTDNFTDFVNMSILN